MQNKQNKTNKRTTTTNNPFQHSEICGHCNVKVLEKILFFHAMQKKKRKKETGNETKDNNPTYK